MQRVLKKVRMLSGSASFDVHTSVHCRANGVNVAVIRPIELLRISGQGVG